MNQQLQQTQAELNKKDYELQRQDSKSSWEHEQQQEMCDKLRAALQEKDKTIEVIHTEILEVNLFALPTDCFMKISLLSTGALLLNLLPALYPLIWWGFPIEHSTTCDSRTNLNYMR